MSAITKDLEAAIGVRLLDCVNALYSTLSLSLPLSLAFDEANEEEEGIASSRLRKFHPF